MHHHHKLFMKFQQLYLNQMVLLHHHRQLLVMHKQLVNNYIGQVIVKWNSFSFFCFYLSVSLSESFLFCVQLKKNPKQIFSLVLVVVVRLLLFFFLLHIFLKVLLTLVLFFCCFVFYFWLERFVSFSFNIILFLKTKKYKTPI